ncbi:MAG: hypothetical protein ABJQ34_19155 [Paracoccaceae bacterium]
MAEVLELSGKLGRKTHAPIELHTCPSQPIFGEVNVAVAEHAAGGAPELQSPFLTISGVTYSPAPDKIAPFATRAILPLVAVRTFRTAATFYASNMLFLHIIRLFVSVSQSDSFVAVNIIKEAASNREMSTKILAFMYQLLPVVV